MNTTSTINSKERLTAIPAVYLFLVKGDEVLLLLRENTGYEDGKYSTIAGHVEKDETVVECLKREVFEEAGVKVNETTCKMKHVMYDSTPKTLF